MFAFAGDDDLVDVIDQMHGVANAAMHALLSALVEMDQRETWRIDGATSTAMWLQLRHGLSELAARQWVRVARGLVFCPSVAASFRDGHLSWDQLVAAVDLVAHGGMTDDVAGIESVGRTAAELQRLAREAKKVSRRESNHRHHRRYVALKPDSDGVRISGWLPDAEGKNLEIAFERGLAHDDPGDGLSEWRPIGERRADVLSDLVSARLGADADPDRATIVVHTNAATLAAGNDDLDLAAIQLGPVISTATLHRLACDGRCQLVVDDALGRTVAVAKTIHAVPQWLRRRILDRDGGCRWPGCARTTLLHAHHIRWWTRDGGPTEEANLTALCAFHHRLVHEGGWDITGDPTHRLTFTSTDGHTVRAGPPGLRNDVRHALGLPWTSDPPAHAA
jgi:hypothetical protein